LIKSATVVIVQEHMRFYIHRVVMSYSANSCHQCSKTVKAKGSFLGTDVAVMHHIYFTSYHSAF